MSTLLQRRRQLHAAERYRQLRATVYEMPLAIAAAMLSGLESTDTLRVGEYSDGDGACPILLAHRNGAPARPTRFAQAWDAFCGVERYEKRRAATPHEVRMLRLLLQQRIMPSTERRLRPSTPAPVRPAVPAPAAQPVAAQPRELVAA